MILTANKSNGFKAIGCLCPNFPSQVLNLALYLDPSVPRALISMGPFAAVSNESMIRGLVPLDKALTSARNDAKETCAAIQGVRMDVTKGSRVNKWSCGT